jgi:DNA repair protein RadC
MSKDRSTLPGAPSLSQVYSEMIGTLQREVGEERLSGLLSELRSSGIHDALPLAGETDVLRLLSRLGWIDTPASEETVKRAEEIVREFAEAVDRTPAIISIVLRLYAEGLYGVAPSGVCGNPPRCKACALTRLCAHYNAPPSRSAREKVLAPAERLRVGGAGSLADDELLALVAGSGKTPAKSMELARELLDRYGSLRKLAAATGPELESYASVSRPAAARILSAFALAGRMAEEARRHGPAVRSGKDFYDLYHKRLRDQRQEIFLVVLLDQRNRILRDEQVSQGSLTGALVHPREVFAPAIRESAAAIALVHNHPSGDPSPSQEDRTITRRLSETANVVGIRLLDHVIVGEGTYTSFIDDGLL